MLNLSTYLRRRHGTRSMSRVRPAGLASIATSERRAPNCSSLSGGVALLGRAVKVIGCMMVAAGVATAAAAQQSSGPQVIPLHSQPGHAVSIEGRIGDQTGTFFFDSGWGLSAVTPDMAKRIGCKPWGQVVGFRAIGERVNQQQCQPATLVVDGRKFSLPTVSLIDLQRYMAPGSPNYVGAIGLDAFAGKAITLRLKAQQIVVETPASLRKRVALATPIPIRLVRDSEGAALTVNVGVPTASGTLWMELDNGNLGGTMVGRHAAALVGLDPDKPHGQTVTMPLAGNVVVKGPAQVLDLIMDGDIGADFLGHWDLTLDLATSRGWLSPA